METILGTDSRQRSADSSDSPDGGIGDASSTIVTTVSALIDVMSRGGINELDVDYLDVRIRLRGTATTTVPAAPVDLASNSVVPAPAPVTAGQVVTAPMVGTFYSAPTPGDPPFVQVGDTVRTGQIIGIIEAMKIMNEIASEVSGVVSEVLIANGQPVEYGSELLRLSSPSGTT